MNSQVPRLARQHASSFTSIREQARPYRSQAILRKAHLRNNIVYHYFKFLQCDSEEPCE
jgi:hypothetical protein